MSDKRIEDRLSAIDDVKAGVPVMGIASKLPAGPDLELMDRLTAILAAPLPSLIIGDPRNKADMLQDVIIDLKIAAGVRLQAEVDKIPAPRR